VDVLLPVSEHKTGRAAFGAGYSSKDGLVGYVEVADTNLFGRGQTANIKWEFGKRVNMYDVSFMEPYLFGTNTCRLQPLQRPAAGVRRRGAVELLGAPKGRRRDAGPAPGRLHPGIAHVQGLQ